MVAQDVKEFGVQDDSIHLFDDTVIILPIEQLRKVIMTDKRLLIPNIV